MKNFVMGTLFGSLSMIVAGIAAILFTYCEYGKTKREELNYKKVNKYSYDRRREDD